MSGTDTDKGKDGAAAVAAALAALERAPAGPKLPAGGLTTEYVQAVLEENQCLILAVVDSLRACKTADCAAFQKRLNTNLLWLASIADKQHKAKAAAAGAGPTKAAAAAAASAKKAKPKAEVKYWTDAEHELFLEAYEKYGKDLPRIAEHVGTRTSAQVRSHMQKWLIREEKKRKREEEAREKDKADTAARVGEQQTQPQQPQPPQQQPQPQQPQQPQPSQLQQPQPSPLQPPQSVSHQQPAAAAAPVAVPLGTTAADDGEPAPMEVETLGKSQPEAANPPSGANAEQLMAGPTAEGMAVADDGAPTVTVNAALLQ